MVVLGNIAAKDEICPFMLESECRQQADHLGAKTSSSIWQIELQVNQPAIAPWMSLQHPFQVHLLQPALQTNNFNPALQPLLSGAALPLGTE